MVVSLLSIFKYDEQCLLPKNDDARALSLLPAACSLVLLGGDPGPAVADEDVELVRTLHDLLPLLGTDAVGDLRAVLVVVHQEHVQVLGVVHGELVEPVRDPVPGLLVVPEPDLRHHQLALEPAAHRALDPSGLPPGGQTLLFLVAHALPEVGLEAGELLEPLLHDLLLQALHPHTAPAGPGPAAAAAAARMRLRHLIVNTPEKGSSNRVLKRENRNSVPAKMA